MGESQSSSRTGGGGIPSRGHALVDLLKRWPTSVWISLPVIVFLAGVLILLGIGGHGPKTLTAPRTAATLASTPTGGAASSTTVAATGAAKGSGGRTKKGAQSATTATTQPKGVTFKVTGTGTSTALSVTIVGGGQQQETRGVALPFIVTVPNNRPDYGLTAQSSSASTDGTLTCEIDQPGRAPVTKTSRGAYVVVTCIGTPR